MTNGVSRKYDPATVELALVTAAVLGSNWKEAAALLEARYGIEVAPSTISSWARGKEHERYLEICEEQKAITQQVMAQKAVEIAAEAASGAQMLVADTIAQKDQIEPKYLAPSARNLAQVHASMTEKALVLRGQPTEITKLENLDEIVNVLAGLGVVPEEVRDAEVIDEASEPQATLPAGT